MTPEMSSSYLDDGYDALLSQIELTPPSTDVQSTMKLSELAGTIDKTPLHCSSSDEYVCATPSPQHEYASCFVDKNENNNTGSEDCSLLDSKNINCEEIHCFGTEKEMHTKDENKGLGRCMNSSLHNSSVQNFLDRRIIKIDEDKNISSMRLFKNFVFSKIDLSLCEMQKSMTTFMCLLTEILMMT